MKRPEGFDRPGASTTGASTTGATTTGATPPRKPTKADEARPKPVVPTTGSSKSSGPTPVSPAPVAPPVPGRTQRRPASEIPLDARARRDLKRAEKTRRAYERGEARRFTRRSRRRRGAWLAGGLSLVVVTGFVTAAVYSPLLSLKTIRVEGASRVSSASVRAAAADQLGRPLALIDFDSITRALGKFPLIRSFVTETVPPDTLIIRIAERAPIATLATSNGFSVVDPAGIVIDSGAERRPGLPLIELGTASKASPAFVAAVGVLLALPADLLKQVDTVTAQTSDDVTLSLTGGQTVVWGSVEQSALKAKVLAAVITVGGTATKYDVSAPNHPVLGGN